MGLNERSRGAAALIDHPQTQQAFQQSADHSSYQAVFADVRRRLDTALLHPTLFAAVGIDSTEILRLQRLLQDATIFYRTREAGQTLSRRLTRWRNLAFTLLFQELKKLQTILAAALHDTSHLQPHSETTHWRRLNSLTRRWRPQPTQ